MIADGPVEVLIIAPISDAALHTVQAVDAAVRVVDGRQMFEAEYRRSWPPATVRRYLPAKAGPREALPQAERDRLLATAEVALGTFPFPKDLRSRAARLRWFHQLPAGASNLRHGDLWGSDVTVTTSRGLGNTLPMAEYVLAAILHFVKGFHRAAPDRTRHEFEHRAYPPRLPRCKTGCVVGLGGIGRDVARLCEAVGMRVVGTRRRGAARGAPPGRGGRAGSSPRLPPVLRGSGFVSVRCPLAVRG